jgi:protein arginine N-methyltransferase 1
MHEYSFAGYGSMMADSGRIRAYEGAIRQIVKPGAVVVDLGTGSGILALLACRAGARKVFAIEPANIIQLAREIATANGYADRIEFIQRVSTEVTLPERADAIVSEIHGVLPLFQEYIPTVVDARQRWLSLDGAMIPRDETIWAAIAEAPEQYNRLVGPWNQNHGLDMSAGRRFATNIWCKSRVEPEQLLVEPARWATLDYASIVSPDIRRGMSWSANREGTAHGIVAWFDAVLAEGIGFSNAPGTLDMIFGQAFFPLSQPVQLAVGDMVSVDLQAKLVNGDYVWRWNTRVESGTNPAQVKADFKQSTFFGVLRSPEQLTKWRGSN